MVQWYEIVSLVLCLFASGFFSATEAVLMSIGIDRAKQIIDEGGRNSGIMKFMIEKPNEILTTILVGNNIVNILAASLTTTIAARIFQNEAIGVSVGVSTILILIFGEIAPKTFARSRAEKLAFVFIKILRVVYYLIYPAVFIIAWLIKVFMGDNAKLHGRFVTKNDIEYMVNRAEQDKSIDSKQIDLLNSILEFPTIKVKDIMIPRNKVKMIDKNMQFHEIVNFVKQDTHSRYPVCDGDLDETIGFLHVKDLALVDKCNLTDFNILEYVKDPFFVYEHMKIQAVFDHMNRKKVHLALVKDENGLVVGIVTLEDIIEEIFGEIQDEHDDEEVPVGNEEEMLEEEGLQVDGSTSLRDLYNDYDIRIPLNDHYSTLAGFLLDMLGNTFPESGMIIIWEGLSFELEKVEDFEIKEVRIRDVSGDKHLFSKSEAEESEEREREKEREKVRSSDFHYIDRDGREVKSTVVVKKN